MKKLCRLMICLCLIISFSLTLSSCITAKTVLEWDDSLTTVMAKLEDLNEDLESFGIRLTRTIETKGKKETNTLEAKVIINDKTPHMSATFTENGKAGTMYITDGYSYIDIEEGSDEPSKTKAPYSGDIFKDLFCGVGRISEYYDIYNAEASNVEIRNGIATVTLAIPAYYMTEISSLSRNNDYYSYSDGTVVFKFKCSTGEMMEAKFVLNYISKNSSNVIYSDVFEMKEINAVTAIDFPEDLDDYSEHPQVYY